jgi:hypothetical protein
MSIELAKVSLSAISTVLTFVIAVFAFRVSKKQTQSTLIHQIQEQFDLVVETIAANPKVRPLFYHDKVSRLIPISSLTPEDRQVGAMIAELLCDAFESAFTADHLTKGGWSDDHFYGQFFTKMINESLFLREFIEERSGQYDPVLILKLREIFPATEAGDDS